MNDIEKYNIIKEMTNKIKERAKDKKMQLVGNLANEDKQIINQLSDAISKYEVNGKKVFEVENYGYYILIFKK